MRTPTFEVQLAGLASVQALEAAIGLWDADAGVNCLAAQGVRDRRVIRELVPHQLRVATSEAHQPAAEQGTLLKNICSDATSCAVR